MKHIPATSHVHSLTASFHRAAYFFEHNFPQIIFAIAFPTVVSLLIFWTGIGVTVAQLNQISTFQELTALFSWGSPTTYMLFMMGLVLFGLNIIGLIAGPLVMVNHERMKVTEILPKSISYFFAYLRLSILVVLALLALYIVVYLLIIIISTIVGFIDFNYLEPTFNTLAAILPNAAIILMALLFMFAPFALIQHNQGAYHALATSVVLVRLNFWHIVLRLSVVISMILLISFLLLFIPYVGYGLSFFMSGVVMTVYNYVLYEDVTGVTWH